MVYEPNIAMPTAFTPAMNLPIGQNRIRLVILEDHALFRASLARLLAAENGFEVVGECGTAAEALETLANSPVDVVLVDFELRTEQASDFILASRTAGYRGRFLIVAGALDAESLASAFQLGASGIFLKSEAPDRLVQAIRLVATGAVWVDQRVIQLLVERCVNQRNQAADQKSGGLQEVREQKVLLGILAGQTNRKIGTSLGLSESSVKNILQGLFARTGVRTRSQLVRLALEGSLGNTRQLLQPPASEAPASVHSK